MMPPMKLLVPLLPLALLAACGRDDATAGGVTPGEARALDEAAEMLEARRLPDEALAPPTASASASTPATQ